MKALPDPARPAQRDPIAIALAEDIGSGDLTSPKCLWRLTVEKP